MYINQMHNMLAKKKKKVVYIVPAGCTAYSPLPGEAWLNKLNQALHH